MFVSGNKFGKFVFKCFRKGFVMYFMHKFCQFQFKYISSSFKKLRFLYKDVTRVQIIHTKSNGS